MLYDLYRSLSQSVHPSLGTIAAHIQFDETADGGNKIDKSGALSADVRLAQAFGLSAVWSVEVVSLLTENEPLNAELRDVATRSKLPIELEMVDGSPDRLRPPP